MTAQSALCYGSLLLTREARLQPGHRDQIVLKEGFTHHPVFHIRPVQLKLGEFYPWVLSMGK